MNNASTRRWRNLAFGLAMLPGLSASTGAALGQQPGAAAVVAPKKQAAGDPRALLKSGRDALAAGKIEDAQDLARQAEAAGRTTRWGLFEDSPSKLLDAVTKAKSARDRAESETLMAEARKLVDGAASDPAGKAADLDRAQQMAYKADRLHGPYGVFDRGERPTRLNAEIDALKAKARASVKAAPSASLVPAGGVAAQAGMGRSGGIQTVGFNKPAGVANVSAPEPDATPTATSDAPKAQAQALCAEGKANLAAGRFAEAKAKAMQAMQVPAAFAVNEDSPALLLQQVQAAGLAKIQALCGDARAKAGTPAAAACVDEAAALASALGLDAKPILDLRASVVAAPVTALPGLAMPAAPVTGGQGAELLAKARLELRKGDLEAARRFCVEAFTNHPAVQSDAQALLRTIDSEDYTQKRSAAGKTLDAAVAAYSQRDFRTCLSVLGQIEPSMLPADKQAQFGELASKARAELAKPARAAATPAAGTTGTNLAATPGLSGVEPAAYSGDGAAAPAAPRKAAGLADQQAAMQQVQFQVLRSEGLKVQSEATAKFAKGETTAALEMLQAFLDKVKASPLDPARASLLTGQVSFRLDNLRLLKKDKDFFTKEARELRTSKSEVSGKILNEQNKKEQCAKLMKKFHQLLDDAKFREAQMVAQQAHELDPNDPSTLAAVSIAKVSLAQKEYDGIKGRKEEMFRVGMNEAEDVGPAVSSKDPLKLDPEAMRRNRDRNGGSVNLRSRTEAEKQIEMRLTKPITLKLKNTPIRQAIDDIRVMTGVNVVLDERAMDEENVSSSKPITLEVTGIAMKSALNILLRQANLTHIVEDDVLKITTEKQARGKLVKRVFSVAELVIPIDNYAIPGSQQLTQVLEAQMAAQRGVTNAGAANVPASMLGAGTPAAAPGSFAENVPTPNADGRLVNNQTQPGGNPANWSVTKGGTKGTLEESLMKLVKSTIAPMSWADVGGSGTVDYYPIGMAMVVNQTSDVIEEVYELLEALRRLQDLEVSVEVRIVSLSESFFERIGLDFSMNVKTDDSTKSIEPSITTGINTPEPYINDLRGKGVIAGLTPAGTFTRDLDIPIKSTSFNYAVPPFGGYPNEPGQNGGLSLGLAFLNDIQVFMFMEAAQGDRRINVMQAPKLTLFSGQTSTIQIQDVQFFVNNVSVVSNQGQLTFIPQNTPLPYGVTVTMQAVVSGDRRFVRLNLIPTLTSLASTNVPLFPITSFITPQTLGGLPGTPIPFTQYLQQPGFTTVQVQTTVNVPDGGTVLLGGLKTLSEGRNEFGPPVLSKVPYINRLFKNTGYGRDAQSLMLMVTPRIIINSEEEQRATGFNPDTIRQ